ncbi:MAG: methyltransferase domain-containing protein [Pseudohongiellaceae bacterium]
MKSLLSLFAAACLLCSSASALDIAALERAMANPDRPAADKERDDSRKAPQVLDFLGLEEGMTVLDINAAAGWYTEVLSYAVGSNGTVHMQNDAGGRAEEAAATRAGRLDNVEQVEDIGSLPANSVDFAITALNFHDFHNSNPERAQAILADVKRALKPGGILGIIDHEGTEGADNQALHRISVEETLRAGTQAGFAVVGLSDVLDNPQDDHTVGPFDESLGRNTDRFVMKLVDMDM